MIVRPIRRQNTPFVAKICSWLAIYLPCLFFLVISRSPMTSAQGKSLIDAAANLLCDCPILDSHRMVILLLLRLRTAPTPQPSSDWIAEIVRIEFVFDSMRDILSGQPSLDFQEITMNHIQDRLEQYSEVQTNVIDLSVTADISDQEMSQGTEEFLPLRVVVSILLRYKTFSGVGDPVGWVGSTFASSEDQEAFISSISLSNPEVYSGLKTVDSILVEGKKPIKRTEAPSLSPTPSPSVATESSLSPTLSPSVASELQSEFVDVAFRLMPMEGVLDTMGIIDFEQVTSHYSELAIATRGNVHDVRVALNVQDQFIERDGREMLTNSDNSLRYLQNEPGSTLVVSARMLLEYRTADQANSNPEEWVAGAFDNAEEKLAFIEELRQVNANAFGSVESVEVLTGDDIPTKPPPELQSSFVDLAVRLVSTEGVLNDMEKVDFQVATAGYVQQVMENDSRIYDARVALNIVDQFIDNGNAFNTRFLQLEEVEALVVSTRLLAEFRFLGDSQDVDAEEWTADAFKNEKAQNAYIKSLQLENPDAFRFVESVEVLVGEDIPSSATHISVTVPITMRLLNTRTTLQSDETSTFEEGTAAHVQGYIDSLHQGLQSLQVDVSVTDQVVIFDIGRRSCLSIITQESYRRYGHFKFLLMSK